MAAYRFLRTAVGAAYFPRSAAGPGAGLFKGPVTARYLGAVASRQMWQVVGAAGQGNRLLTKKLLDTMYIMLIKGTTFALTNTASR